MADEPAEIPTATEPSERPWRWLSMPFRLAAAGYAAMLAFAWLWPHDFRAESMPAVLGAAASFFSRTFLLHAGIGVAVLSASAMLRARWKAALVLGAIATAGLAPHVAEYGGGMSAARSRHAPASAPSAPGSSLMVMTCNLLAGNTQSAIIDEVVAAAPDVVVFQECNARWLALIEPRLGDEYPHRAIGHRRGNPEVALFSRIPLGASEEFTLGADRHGTVRVRVDLGGTPVAIYGLHLKCPATPARLLEARLQFADLLDRLRAETLPAIVVGDFNFPKECAQADSLAALGYRDAWDIAGTGRGDTWPKFMPFFLPGVRIDHIYLGRGLTCISAALAEGSGSDHRPVVAVVSRAP